MSKQHCDITVDHIKKKLGAFEDRWASMRAEEEKKARQEKPTKGKNIGECHEIQRMAGRREAQEVIPKMLRESGTKGLLKTWVRPQLWNPTHERLATLDEL